MNKKDGYVVDTTYPAFFYKEMQPLWLNTVINFLGFKAIDITKSFSYLELACATGTNLLVCAINYPEGYFVGVDFNKDHIDKAKQSAQSLGLKNIEFIHCDFSAFLEKNILKFDFIVNHGTFSWISPAHQKNILEIVSQSLNDLGIFYLHYMCYPGSADLLPVQKLLNLVDQHNQASSLDSIETGKKLFCDLNDAGAFIDHPKIEAVFKTLEQRPAYLAHEFLTDYWQPQYSVDVHHQVHQAAQLAYLGSANPCENMDSISIPLKIQKIIHDTQAPALKEYLKDLARDAKQRADIFQRKPAAFKNADHLRVINQIDFKLLAKAPQNSGIRFKTVIGEIKAPKEIIAPLIECLSKKEISFRELLTLPAFKNNPIFLIETIFLMMNAHYVHPCSSTAEQVDQNKVNRFNQIMKKDKIQLRIMKDCATAIDSN